MPLSLLFTQPAYFFMLMVVVLLGITIHEYAHAYSAYKLGDDTAAQQGRLTMNPFAHIDGIGLLFLALVGFGWGKPVPVNDSRLYNRRWGPLMVSLSGPLANIILAAAIVVFSIVFFSPSDSLAWWFLFYMVAINLVLAVFNLIPIPPLDGSSILFALFPSIMQKWEPWLQRNSLWLLIALVLLMNVAHWSPFVQFYELAMKLMGGA